MSFDLMHGTIPALVAGLVVVMISVALAGRRSQHERHAGVHALRNMSFDELRPLLLMMLKRRGFELPPGAHHADRTHPDFVVLRGKSRYLVHTRFEPNDRIDAATVDRFATMIAAQNADGGFLVATCPIVTNEMTATNTRLEVIGVEAFWRELRPLLPDDLAADVRADARKHRRRRLQVAALAGVATAALVYGITMKPATEHELPVAGTAGTPATTIEPAARPETPTPAAAAVPAAPPPMAPAATEAPAPSPAVAAPAPAPAPTPAVATPSPATAADLNAIDALTEEQRAQRRADAAESVRGVTNVVSAEWSTKSTLIVKLPNAEAEVRKAAADTICPMLLRWEELRYTRLQVQDVTDDQKVSWRSCQ